jgi:hypothetical protein
MTISIDDLGAFTGSIAGVQLQPQLVKELLNK